MADIRSKMIEKGVDEVGKAFGATVGRKIIEKPVEGFLDSLGNAASAGRSALRQSLYNQLVETVSARPGKEEEKFLTSARGNYKKRVMPETERIDTKTGQTTFDLRKSSENPALNWMFENPSATADIGSIGIPIAAGAAALGLGHHFTSKPRSDYALGLSGLGPSTGNSNIDAARASAHFQQETAELKFQHQMALQQARAEAQIPGRQGSAGSTGLPPSIGGGNARDAYQMAMSLVNTPTPIYK